MSDLAAERLIVEAMSTGYGDRSTSPLDRVVAHNILQTLRSVFWMSPEEVAMLVESAGGEIRITEKQLTENAPYLTIYRDERTNEVVIKSRRSDNPTIVESGPINVTVAEHS